MIQPHEPGRARQRLQQGAIDEIENAVPTPRPLPSSRVADMVKAGARRRRRVTAVNSPASRDRSNEVEARVLPCRVRSIPRTTPRHESRWIEMPPEIEWGGRRPVGAARPGRASTLNGASRPQ
jgi:hypothetical protein